MSRNGAVTLLGAGASVEAGYPVAGGLLKFFEEAVAQAGQHQLQQKENILQFLAKETGTSIPQNEPNSLPTIGEWFQTYWLRFSEVANKLRPLAVPKLRPDGRPELPSPALPSPTGGVSFPDYPMPVEGEPTSPAPAPYLETFFAFYDDYMRPIIAATVGDPGRLASVQHRFRQLREIAIQVAYGTLSTYGRPPATYLQHLFALRGPEQYRCAIASLNFDVTIEQIAGPCGVPLYDGFASKLNLVDPPPPEWVEPGLENLKKLWAAVAENTYSFSGFERAPTDASLLLKLHGSLGWYVLEEGGGDIGSRDELRHNTGYKYFRLPYEFLWQPDMQGLVSQLAAGGSDDPVTRTQTGSLSRKAGAVWVRPYLVFARALKTHPDRVFLDLTATFARLLDKAAAVLVIGYSWGDPHVNDLIFDAVAGGASLINVSRSPYPQNVLALWIQRFPTTFHILRRRLFMFGGGAERVLEQGNVELPSGRSLDLDLVSLIEQGLPVELSLERASS